VWWKDTRLTLIVQKRACRLTFRLDAIRIRDFTWAKFNRIFCIFICDPFMLRFLSYIMWSADFEHDLECRARICFKITVFFNDKDFSATWHIDETGSSACNSVSVCPLQESACLHTSADFDIDMPGISNGKNLISISRFYKASRVFTDHVLRKSATLCRDTDRIAAGRPLVYLHRHSRGFSSCEVLKILMSSMENFWRESLRAFAIGEYDRMENR